MRLFVTYQVVDDKGNVVESGSKMVEITEDIKELIENFKLLPNSD